MTPSKDALHHLLQLTGLAERLSGLDLVIARLDCHWSSFGCWTLEVQRGLAAERYAAALGGRQWDSPGPAVMRVYWDGKDQVLSAEEGKTPPLSSPGKFRRVFDERMKDVNAARVAAEAFLTNWARLAND